MVLNRVPVLSVSYRRRYTLFKLWFVFLAILGGFERKPFWRIFRGADIRARVPRAN